MSNNLTTVYLPTSVDEKPNDEGYYHTLGKEMVAYFHKDARYYSIYLTTKGWDGNVSHWLKKSTGYFHTKEELEKLTGDLDKECELLHQCITELYNIDAAVPIIKKYLNKIRK